MSVDIMFRFDLQECRLNNFNKDIAEKKSKCPQTENLEKKKNVKIITEPYKFLISIG